MALADGQILTKINEWNASSSDCAIASSAFSLINNKFAEKMRFSFDELEKFSSINKNVRILTI